MMARILEALSPREAKKLGRQVPHTMRLPGRFIGTALYKVLINKFLSSPRLTKLLLKTGNSFLVEAGF